MVGHDTFWVPARLISMMHETSYGAPLKQARSDIGMAVFLSPTISGKFRTNRSNVQIGAVLLYT